MPKNEFKLNEKDKLALAQMVYGENVGQADDVLKMTIQSAINRLRSGKTKEFGGTMGDVLKKGYYAVRNPNVPYKESVSGKFSDVSSKAKFGAIKKLVDVIVGDQDFGNAMFYFTPEEEIKLNKSKGFNFKAVKPTGKVGQYNTYGY